MSGLRVEKIASGRFAVMRGAAIVRVYSTRTHAETGLDTLITNARPERRERCCMSCQQTFVSEHSGHRMCAGCRSSASLPNQFYG